MTKGIPFQGTPSTAPATHWAAITPHDSTNFSNGVCRAVYVGVGGDVVAVTAAGDTATFVGVPTGAVLPVAALRINSTSTTATDMVALY